MSTFSISEPVTLASSLSGESVASDTEENANSCQTDRGSETVARWFLSMVDTLLCLLANQLRVISNGDLDGCPVSSVIVSSIASSVVSPIVSIISPIVTSSCVCVGVTSSRGVVSSIISIVSSVVIHLRLVFLRHSWFVWWLDFFGKHLAVLRFQVLAVMNFRHFLGSSFDLGVKGEYQINCQQSGNSRNFHFKFQIISNIIYND